MAGLPLKTAIGTYGVTQPLKDGTVSSDKVSLEHVEVSPVTSIFRRMIRSTEFDVSEMALSTYLCARAFRKPITAIPVFVLRGFHHGAIQYNTKSGISSPKDLEGKKVGVRGYTVTTGVWVRGILQHRYGVDLDKVTWVLAGTEHVGEFISPRNTAHAGGSDLGALLAEGRLDAAIGVGRVDSPDVAPLIPNAREAAIEYYKDEGVYPINHTVVVKNQQLAANPWLGEELFGLFKEAKESYVRKLNAGGELDAADQAIKENGEVVGGDPFPSGVEVNRKSLEAIIQFNLDQKIIPSAPTVEEIFATGTLGLQ